MGTLWEISSVSTAAHERHQNNPRSANKQQAPRLVCFVAVTQIAAWVEPIVGARSGIAKGFGACVDVRRSVFASESMRASICVFASVWDCICCLEGRASRWPQQTYCDCIPSYVTAVFPYWPPCAWKTAHNVYMHTLRVFDQTGQ